MRRSDSDHCAVPRWVERPESVRPLDCPALLVLDEPAAVSMARIVERYRVGEGLLEWESPGARVASRLLRAWLRMLGGRILEWRMEHWVCRAMSPLPRGESEAEARRFFSGLLLPSRRLLVHVLYSVGIGGRTVSAAALVHHWASCPIGEEPAQESTTDLTRLVGV